MTTTPSLRGIRTVDYHTAGEPFRIVAGEAPVPAGATVAERRLTAIDDDGPDELDALRRLLCFEPRGHADMYGGFIVPPDDDGADFGVLFWHKDGFSTACGHGTIALGVWAVETGRVTADPDGTTVVTIDVPSGRVTVSVEQQGGSIRRVTFRNVVSHVIARGVPVSIAGREVAVDLSFSGAIYASVPASVLGLEVTPDHYSELIEAGRAIKWALNDSPLAQHAADPRLSGVYGTIIFDDLGRTADGPHQRNVTVFADGEVDRSPCGSGTGARVALLADDGTLAEDETLAHDSIVGTRFTARFERADAAGPATTTRHVIPEITGTAYKTGEHTFVLDPRDALGAGFVLR